MIQPLRACAIALCVVAAPSLHAASFTAYGEDHLDLAAPTPANLIPTFTATTVNWSWSSSFTSAVRALDIAVSDGLAHPAATGPASAAFSLMSMTVDEPDQTGALSVLSERLGGSISFSSKVGLLTARAATLTLSDLRIDHQSNQVFARISDAAGTAIATDFAVFRFDDAAYVLPPGSYAPVLTCLPTTPQCISRVNGAESHPSLNNLRFTGEGRSLWDQTFQIHLLGLTAMNSVDSLGSLSAAPVPEPSTWVLMGIGLVGMGFVRRRLAA